MINISNKLFSIHVGASALHLAIAYFNNELVQDLVEAGANVEQRAIGKDHSLIIL